MAVTKKTEQKEKGKSLLILCLQSYLNGRYLFAFTYREQPNNQFLSTFNILFKQEFGRKTKNEIFLPIKYGVAVLGRVVSANLKINIVQCVVWFSIQNP